MEIIINQLRHADVNVVDRDDVEAMGKRRRSDMVVSDRGIFGRILKDGSLALGETYMEGGWDCDDLEELFYRVLSSGIDREVRVTGWSEFFRMVGAYLMNLQTVRRSLKVAEEHYNIGNDLYRVMLGETMTYSCAYWRRGNDDLDRAQRDKFDLICRKLDLRETDVVLDIGCGFGSLARYIATEYGCRVVGVTISTEQLKYCTEQNSHPRVTYLGMDYRNLRHETLGHRFTKVVSVGMFEHVGHKNFGGFFAKVHELLTDDGIFLLHTIGSNTTSVNGDAWIDKYIFPGGLLPSIRQIGEATEDLLVMEDWHNFGVHYERTLLAWYRNYVAGKTAGTITVGPRFDRMWCYYLLTCASFFKARRTQLWQIVFTKRYHREYLSIRYEAPRSHE